MNFYTPVQRAKQHAGIAGEASPVEPMHVELMHRCNQAERPKTLKAKTSTHRLIRRIGLSSVGSTGVTTPDDPTKSRVNVGAIVQRHLKTDLTSTG